MKKFAIFLAVLLLSSCIGVDDLGAYWDKGFIDPALTGAWGPDPDAKTPDESKPVIIAKVGDIYHVIDEGAKEDNKVKYARSLGMGPYVFLMIEEDIATHTKGELLRYKINGDKATFYVLNSKAVRSFIQDRTDAKNIVLGEGDDRLIKITTLDDATYKVISEVPDNETYWTVSFRKQRIR